MKSDYIYKFISIDEYSSTPKYLQLSNSIVKAIENGKIQKDDILPSINELSYEFSISRDTAEKSYKHLKKLGIVESIAGKGYFIAKTDIVKRLKVFLLFNKLSEHKKFIYDSFVAALGEHALVDFYIYNNDFLLFKKLILNIREKYSHYVVIPHFIEGNNNAAQILEPLMGENLILLDKLLPGLNGDFGAVYENFEKDIYQALESAVESLQKYDTIKVVFPPNSYYPQEILKGISQFAQDYAFNFKAVYDIKTEEIEKGNLYITVMEEDLVTLIERLIMTKHKVGKDIGIISYNETPVKKIILKGISTVSTDFRKMGEMAANLLLENHKYHLEVPFNIIVRDSL
ncbi:MAG: GntR family transcriptional regulator [Bacteroidetes bacterium]|nr:GntR family transcriptional regulator [Bacteroidota bacterium]